MAEFFPGQCLRIKSAEEIADEYGYSIGDFDEDGIEIGNIVVVSNMTRFFGREYIVADVDGDDTVLIPDTEYWWPFELLDLVDEPGTLFGFRAGDLVEFKEYEDIMRTDSWFVEPMKYLCGTSGVITQIIPNNSSFAEVKMKDAFGEDIHWRITTQMIDHADTSADVLVDDWAAVLET